MQLLSSYVYIPVSNLENSARWYDEMLDLKVFKKDEIYFELRNLESNIRVMLIPNEGNITAHMKYLNGNQAVYGFVVNDAAIHHKKLGEAGVEVGAISNYDGASFGFTDPDGNVLELWSENN